MSKRQHDFARKIAILELVAIEMGFEISNGHAFRCQNCKVGKKNSLHKSRLAKDIHLYLNGKWLKDGTGHHKLHDVWDLMGGKKRVKGDLNHYASK